MAGAAGTVLVGAGVAAVFIAENEVGSATLIVVGGLFLLMGVSGRTIESVRVGESSHSFGSDMQFAEFCTSLARRPTASLASTSWRPSPTPPNHPPDRC
ncbi:hypothetical protein GCM10009802_10670 [Streptomyces synnematoformans]|uniref:Uncharacterized protein n=1 Tax=Streptomyces synnematoformans TaxID=415721 RepID=A0ABN2XLV7_9ACTN